MFCPKCGEIVRDTALKCPNCNASLRGDNSRINRDCDHKHSLPKTRPNRDCEHTHAQPDTVESTSPGTWKNPAQWDVPMKHTGASRQSGTQFDSITPEELLEMLKDFFARYKDFGGRTGKRQFWITILFSIIGQIVLTAMTGPLSAFVFVAFLVPTLALIARRLHDVGKGNEYLVFALIPVLGLVILIPLLLQESAPSNQWGPRPMN